MDPNALQQLLQQLNSNQGGFAGTAIGNQLPSFLRNILGFPQVNRSGSEGEMASNAIGSAASAGLGMGAGKAAQGLGEIPGMVGDMGAMNSMAGGPQALLANPEARMVLAKTLAAIIGKVGGAAAPLGAGAALASGQGDTGAAPQQNQPGDQAIQMQMQSLAAAGVPASEAWKRINGDQPLDPSQAPAWGTLYASMGGVNNLPTGNVAGVPPAGPTPTPTPTIPGPGQPGSSAGGGPSPTGNTVNFADMPPDQQALAAAEHGSVPPELAGGAGGTGGAATPVQTPPSAGAPATPPTVGAAAAGAPGGNVPSPELNSYMYDLMNPERASQNAIGTTGGPQYGPGFDWLKSYLQPAFLHNLAGGTLTPEGLKGALQSRLGGTEQDTAAGTIGAMKNFEQQGRESLAGSPGSDLRTLMDRAKAGDTTARDQLTSQYGGMGYMSFLGTQDPGAMGGALAQAIAGDSSKPMAPGLAGVLGNFLGSILTKQVNSGLDVGPNANNRFGYLSGLLGY